MINSPGNTLRNSVQEAVSNNKTIQIPGVPNAYCAKLAQISGFKAIYLSGSGVAASNFALPDLAVTTLNDVVDEVRKITSACDLPLLVDVDTGFGTSLNISRTVRDLERAGAAGIHIEDQIQAKRCGHRPGKQIVSCEEMIDRIKSAVSSRKDESFVVMARTDAFSIEGLEGVIRRSKAYQEAGADMLFVEALSSLDEYKIVVESVGGPHKMPVLANMTEWGKTPLFHIDQLASVGVAIALYPLSAFRAMSLAAMTVYEHILQDGSQEQVIEKMHSRSQIYKVLDYEKYEKQMDELFGARDADKVEDQQEEKKAI